MLQQGKLTVWNDGKGFGFITPSAGGPRVFVHISAFPRGGRRPVVNELITYSVMRDDQSRFRAENARFTVGSNRTGRHAQGMGTAVGVSAMFFVLLIVLVILGVAPLTLIGIYALVSGMTFVLYRVDKNAAQNGRWRVSEGTLHLFGFACGWPGALLAQRIFRHKTRKGSFQVVFWGTVIANCAGLVWILFGDEAAGLRASLGFG